MLDYHRGPAQYLVEDFHSVRKKDRKFKTPMGCPRARFANVQIESCIDEVVALDR